MTADVGIPERHELHQGLHLIHDLLWGRPHGLARGLDRPRETRVTRIDPAKTIYLHCTTFGGLIDSIHKPSDFFTLGSKVGFEVALEGKHGLPERLALAKLFVLAHQEIEGAGLVVGEDSQGANGVIQPTQPILVTAISGK